MNKDKAIQLLERLQDPEPYEPMLTKDAYDAIQMAIDALSADGDTISRKAAIDRATKEHDFFRGAVTVSDKARRDELLNVMCWLGELPPAEPMVDIRDTQYNLPVGTDTISRQAAIDAVNGLIDRFEQILRDISEANVDDSVCGMCEYDGAYIGQSGDWCNECPGFDKDDCFKLSDKTRKKWTEEIIKALPPIQPDIEAIMALPSAQPDIIRCKDCKCWVPGYITDNDDFIPPKCGEWQQMVGHSSDDYCSLAERREDE